MASEAKSTSEESKTTKKATKPLKVAHNRKTNFYVIQREGGGHVPEALKGSWTTPALAERALRSHTQAS